LSLATYLRDRMSEAEIRILDGQMLKISDILKELDRITPDIVGLGPIWLNYKNALAIARQSKKIKSRVIMGGHYATGLAKEILANRGICSDDYCIDAIIQGDGEEAFYQFILGLPFKKIKNLVYQKPKAGFIEFNKTESLDLNNLSISDRNMVDVENYFRISKKKVLKPSYKRHLYFYSKKGCAWRAFSKGGCVFCARMYKDMRTRNPELILEEIDYLVKKFKADFLWDVSDNFFDGKGWFDKFYGIYKDYPFKPTMRIYARANDITEENMKKIADMKIKQIIIGLETGDQRKLISLRKGPTASIAASKKAIKLLKSAGISSYGFFVFGAPNETKESLKKSVEFIHELNELGMTKFWPHILEPYPNSQAFHLLRKRTGDKYKNVDLFDKDQVINDWVKNFCRVSFSEIMTQARKLEFLPNSGYKYS